MVIFSNREVDKLVKFIRINCKYVVRSKIQEQKTYGLFHYIPEKNFGDFCIGCRAAQI